MNTAGRDDAAKMNELDPEGLFRRVRRCWSRWPPQKRATTCGATKGYFDAYAQGKGSVAPFAAQCARRENGFAATNNPDGPVPDKAQPSFHSVQRKLRGRNRPRIFQRLLRKCGTRGRWWWTKSRGWC